MISIEIWSDMTLACTSLLSAGSLFDTTLFFADRAVLAFFKDGIDVTDTVFLDWRGLPLFAGASGALVVGVTDPMRISVCRTVAVANAGVMSSQQSTESRVSDAIVEVPAGVTTMLLLFSAS